MRSNRRQRSSTLAAVATECSMGKENGKQIEEGDGWKEKQRGRGHRKENECAVVAMEGNTSAVGRMFFKVYFPEQSENRLKIPPPFMAYLKELNRQVTLKGPSGNIWKVMLTSDSEGLSFNKGWKQFALDHSLKMGHFLVFTYDGCSQFSVAVLCTAGIEDVAAFNVQSCNGIHVELAEEESVVDVAVANTLALSAPPVDGDRITRKRLRKMNDIENNTAPKKPSGVQKEHKQENLEANINTSDATPMVINNNKENDTPLKRLAKVQKKLDKNKPKAMIDASNTSPTVIDDSEVFSSLLDEYSCRNKSRVRRKDVHRIGRFESRKFRQPVVISQRRPVTAEEKNNALQRAMKFQSKNPFAMQVMMESYVYVGFFLNIPCGFVRESLPRTCKKMTLWDPQGKSWDVKYVYYNDRSVAAFSGGWGKFAVGNNLEKFDVCIFELFKEDNIKVHIYRVVQEITPLIRNSNLDKV